MKPTPALPAGLDNRGTTLGNTAAATVVAIVAAPDAINTFLKMGDLVILPKPNLPTTRLVPDRFPLFLPPFWVLLRVRAAFLPAFTRLGFFRLVDFLLRLVLRLDLGLDRLFRDFATLQNRSLRIFIYLLYAAL